MKKLTIFSITCFFLLLIDFGMIHAQEEPVSNEKEFITWLKEHQNTGGTMVLDEDVHLDDTFNLFNYLPRDRKKIIEILTGNHTIYISGTADFWCADAQLVLKGNGGLDGILHILSKGEVNFYGGSIQLQDDGYAIVQEEHSSFATDESTRRLPIRYAKQPVLILNQSSVNQHTYKRLEEPEPQDFLQEVDCYLSYQGKNYEAALPIIWNLDELKEAHDLNRYYTMNGSLSGSLEVFDEQVFAGLEAKDAYCMGSMITKVIWTQDGVSVEDIQIKKKGTTSYILASLDYDQDIEANRFRLYVSPLDHEDWQLMDESAATPLYFETEVPCQFYIEMEDPQQIYKSNTITYDGTQEFQSMEWIEGNRGGGTSLLPSDDDPPSKNEEEEVAPPAVEVSREEEPVVEEERPIIEKEEASMVSDEKMVEPKESLPQQNQQNIPSMISSFKTSSAVKDNSSEYEPVLPTPKSENSQTKQESQSQKKPYEKKIAKKDTTNLQLMAAGFIIVTILILGCLLYRKKETL